MRILLDECLPARLRRELDGHDVQTVPGAGWAGIKNGKLFRLIANSGKFDVFLTMDKSLPHQQWIKTLPFAVVILRASSNSFEYTRPSCRNFIVVSPISNPAESTFCRHQSDLCLRPISRQGTPITHFFSIGGETRNEGDIVRFCQ